MPAASLRRLLPTALLLCLAGSASAAPACPAGQHEVCLFACFCAPGSQEDMSELYDNVGRMAASGLEEWIVQARNGVASRDLQPIPLHIRSQLEPYYDFQVLEAARYKVGGAEDPNAANAVLQNPDVNAVTLVDLIVFRRESDARDNVALWAHELKHVEQYQQWGVREFAARYTRDYHAVEAPAYAIERQVAGALRASAAATGSAR